MFWFGGLGLKSWIGFVVRWELKYRLLWLGCYRGWCMVRKWKWSMLAYTGFRVCPNRNPGLGEALDAPARSSKVPQLRARQVLCVDLPKQVYGLRIRDMGFGESRVKVVG